MAEAIERKILAGRLKPGDPVGTESELVRQFGVNRSTVREGIRLLEQSGLVAREPSRRLSVAMPHYHRLASRMTRALILQQVTFRELWHTSRALGACRRRPGHGQRDRGGSCRARGQCRGDHARCRAILLAVAELDAGFHKLIARAAHNRVLLLAKEPSSMLVRPTTALIISANPHGIPRLIEAHREILDALQRRDRDKGPAMGRSPPARLESRIRTLGPRPRCAGGAVIADAPCRPPGISGRNDTRSRKVTSAPHPRCGELAPLPPELDVAGTVAAPVPRPGPWLRQKSTVSRRSVSEQLGRIRAKCRRGSRTSSRP